jgi:hypothetical protein
MKNSAINVAAAAANANARKFAAMNSHTTSAASAVRRLRDRRANVLFVGMERHLVVTADGGGEGTVKYLNVN